MNVSTKEIAASAGDRAAYESTNYESKFTSGRSYQPTGWRRSSIDSFRAWLTATTGGAPDAIEPGMLLRFSTNGKRGDTAGWCKLFLDGRGGIAGDFRTGAVATWRAECRTPITAAERARIKADIAAARREREAEQRQHWSRQAPALASLWACAFELQPDDAASLYLKRRGIAISPVPQALRYAPHQAYRHWDGHVAMHPAMLAAVQAPDGTLVAVHRTYLDKRGRKAAVPTVKKLTQTAGLMAGAAIRLHPMGSNGVIGCAEGIETALAARLSSGVPTWAAVSASGMQSFVWPAGARRLIVFADNDANRTGQRAAEALAMRARAAGLSVSVLVPQVRGRDWCDVWAHGAGVEVPA